jgi:uncharacterized protein YehS (DUF1456 family)
MTDGISKEALEQAAKAIELYLNKDKEGLVQLPEEVMKESLDTIAQLAADKDKMPTMTKEAFDAIAEIVEKSLQTADFAQLDKPKMKEAFETIELYINKRVAGKMSAKIAIEKAKPQPLGRQS